VTVAKGADGSDSTDRQGLLPGRRGRADLKPDWNFADDVKCAHGGQSAIWTRNPCSICGRGGIPESQARGLC